MERHHSKWQILWNQTGGVKMKLTLSSRIYSNWIVWQEIFLPAAKPTGLVKANSSSFFLYFLHDSSKDGPNSVSYMTHMTCMTHYDSHDSLQLLWLTMTPEPQDHQNCVVCSVCIFCNDAWYIIVNSWCIGYNETQWGHVGHVSNGSLIRNI